MPAIDQNSDKFPYRLYFNSIYRAAVKMAELEKNDVVLDFGCGDRKLKQFLNGQEYIGYDACQEFSDVKDYHQIKRADVVFVLHVLEHMTDEQIKEFVRWVIGIKPRKIIVSVPCEYLTNKIAAFILNRDFLHGLVHINHWKNIGRLLMERLELVEYKRVWMMQFVSVWIIKNSKRG